MADSNKGVSLRPGDAQEGGFLDDADVTIKSLRAGLQTYAGHTEYKPRAAIVATFITDDDREKVEYYPVGSTDKLVASGDTSKFLPVSGSGGIMKKSKGWYLVGSLINAGFPEDKVTDDLTVFDNTRVHVLLTTLPEKIKDDKGADKDNKALLVTKILKYPWEAAKGGAAKKAGAAGSTAKAATTSAPAAPAAATQMPELAQKATDTVAAVVAEAGGTLSRVKLNQGVFRKLSNDPDRNQIVQTVGNVAFLQTLNDQMVQVGEDIKTLAFDGTNVTLQDAA